MGRFAQAAGAKETGPPAGRTSRKGPIDQVRLLKRSVMIGVYWAIFGFIPFYAFVLHYTTEQLVIGTIIGLGIAVTAIEGAFSQMFRFRKRSSYPGTILVEVGAANNTTEAYDIVLDVVTDLLELKSAAIAKMTTEGEVKLVAKRDMTDQEAAGFLDLAVGTSPRRWLSKRPSG